MRERQNDKVEIEIKRMGEKIKGDRETEIIDFERKTDRQSGEREEKRR